MNQDHVKDILNKFKIKNMLEIFKEIKERWISESPKFWKKILKFSVTLGTSAVAILASDKMFELQSYGIPQIIFTIAGYIIVFCAALGLSAKITKEDKIKENEKN